MKIKRTKPIFEIGDKLILIKEGEGIIKAREYYIDDLNSFWYYEFLFNERRHFLKEDYILGNRVKPKVKTNNGFTDMWDRIASE